MARRSFDRVWPRLHSRLTARGYLQRPNEFDQVREYLKATATKLRDANAYYLPLDAAMVPRQVAPAVPDGVASMPAPEIRRVRQGVREILDPRYGGDAATAQLTLVNKKSRIVRNLIRFLARSREPLVLLGDPGTGKSMTLREVGLLLAQQELRKVYSSLIVFVRLSKMQTLSDDRVDVATIHNLVKSELPPPLAANYQAFLSSGRLIILFDGMDELPRQNYSQIVAALSQFGANVQDNVRTLYSCRINDFSPMFRHKQLVLLPFSPKQTVAFFRDSLPSTLRVDRHTLTPVDVVNLLPKQHAILQIANPLILYLIRHYLMAEHSWPPSRPTLFKTYIRHNYEKYESTVGAGALGYDKAERAWCEIAFAITTANRGANIDVAEITNIDGKTAVLEGVSSGILEKDHESSPYVRFAHHRFQEYFTAAYLTTHAVDGLDWLKLLDDPRWQETVLNLASMAGPAPAIVALRNSIATLVSNGLNRGAAQQLEADRVELASRVIGEVGMQPGSAGELLSEPTVQAIETLLRDGNPSTQVKMLWACKNLDSIDYYRVAEPALSSRVRWVQNQALIIAAEYDSLKRGVSDEFISQMSYDLIMSRFLARAPTYMKAAFASSNALLKRHLAFAFLSLLFSLTISAAGLAAGYWGSFVAYAHNAPFLDTPYPRHPEERPASGVASDGTDDFSSAQSDQNDQAHYEAAPAEAGQLDDKSTSDGSGWGDADLESNDLPDRLRSFLGGLGPKAHCAMSRSDRSGSAFLFLLPPRGGIELVVLGTGAVVLALAFTADQFMRGNIIAIGPIAEILVFLAAPLCILTAGLIGIGSVCVYAVCAPAQDGRRVISDLLAKTMTQSPSAQLLGSALRFTGWFWKDLLAVAATVAAAVVAVAMDEPLVRSSAILLAVLALAGWASIRRDVVRAAFAWVRTEGSLKDVGNGIGVIAIFIAICSVVFGGGYAAQSAFPTAAQYIGIAISLSMAVALSTWMLLAMFERPLLKFYFKNIMDLSDVLQWSAQVKRASSQWQVVLLENVDRQYLGLTEYKYYEALVQLESAIVEEPALSFYWRLRHEIEAIQRQRRGEE